MFSSAVSVARRLKLWKMKPILSRRSCVSFFSLRWVISTPSMRDPAAGGLVEAGEDVHERALAGAGWAHDGREPALGDVDVDAGEGVHGGVALAVDAREAARRHDGAAWASLGEQRLAGELVLETGERLIRPVESLALRNGGGPHDLSS